MTIAKVYAAKLIWENYKNMKAKCYFLFRCNTHDYSKGIHSQTHMGKLQEHENLIFSLDATHMTIAKVYAAKLIWENYKNMKVLFFL